MGTGLEPDRSTSSAMGSSLLSDGVGILPRSVHHLFGGMELLRQESLDGGQTPPQFSVQAQFLELYNEEVIDLLDPAVRVGRFVYFSAL